MEKGGAGRVWKGARRRVTAVTMMVKPGLRVESWAHVTGGYEGFATGGY
jgi:hypothetical protein